MLLCRYTVLMLLWHTSCIDDNARTFRTAHMDFRSALCNTDLYAFRRVGIYIVERPIPGIRRLEDLFKLSRNPIFKFLALAEV
jgi:hypothetical protein